VVSEPVRYHSLAPFSQLEPTWSQCTRETLSPILSRNQWCNGRWADGQDRSVAKASIQCTLRYRAETFRLSVYSRFSDSINVAPLTSLSC